MLTIGRGQGEGRGGVIEFHVIRCEVFQCQVSGKSAFCPNESLNDRDKDEDGEDDVECGDICGEESEDSEGDDGFKTADKTCWHDDGSLCVVTMLGAFFENGGEIHPRGGVNVKGREHEG